MQRSGAQDPERDRRRGPEGIVVQIEIGVHEPVAHTDDQCPRNVRVIISKFETELRCGFSNDLDGARQRELKLVVMVEIGSTTILHERMYQCHGVAHVLKPDRRHQAAY